MGKKVNAQQSKYKLWVQFKNGVTTSNMFSFPKEDAKGEQTVIDGFYKRILNGKYKGKWQRARVYKNPLVTGQNTMVAEFIDGIRI